MNEFESFLRSVQNNCDRVDAVHAQRFTLCTYLLKMREYYRWVHHIPFSAPIRKEKVMDWIVNRESYWEKILPEFESLSIDGRMFDPFDNEEINGILQEQAMVYNGGYGYAGTPMFFFAQLEKMEEREDFSISIASRELSRGVLAFPAVLQEKKILIRKEILSYLLWSKYEEWQMQKPDNPMGKAIRCYDFDKAPLQAVAEMTNNEIEPIVQHELGEGLVGKQLGRAWNEMLVENPHSKLEIFSRAVRDFAADCLTTLPYLLREKQEASLHFYFANLSGMRKEIFPGLLLAYKQWNQTTDYRLIEDRVEEGKNHWSETAQMILHLYQNKGKSAIAEIEYLMQTERI